MLAPQHGYPSHLDARVEYSLGARGPEVAPTAHNLGETAAP
ncbi:hypothetical protein [Wenjunlia tyrosinilytica]|uniref:Uncharacterized protein n=1 Tax=Wenjunlia tyrosinilytica TaxID=1544741 RepID=A0A917ZW42_9ACTN|nr:hypothetical protein [Wenjunlia tyrosinilytica]GGO94929.1 hypothetical protein GCM10012280_50970 [Wenjunlia tyrosinilytica]